MEDTNQETPTETAPVDSSSSYSDTLYQLSHEILNNPLNVILLSISAFLLYKILAGRQAPKPRPEPEVELPRMKKKDLSLEELKPYNGTGDGGRICIAVNGRIYDVTRGKTFYGPGGPYSIFAGRDASRALALFTVSESALKTEYDDLSDLTLAEMNRMKEWQIQLEEKYDFVGRLLKPGQEPVDYTDSEEELNDDEGDEKESWKKPLEKEETDGDSNVNMKEEKNVDDVEGKPQDDEERPEEKDKQEEEAMKPEAKDKQEEEAMKPQEKVQEEEEKSQEKVPEENKSEKEQKEEEEKEQKEEEEKEKKEETSTKKTEL